MKHDSLETRLAAHFAALPEMDRAKKRALKKNLQKHYAPPFYPFSSLFMKWSFPSLAALVLLAVIVNFLYPFSKGGQEYIAEANAYYAEFEEGTIMYQKTRTIEPKDMLPDNGSISYMEERWFDDRGNVLSLVTPEEGTNVVDLSTGSSMILIDESGNEVVYDSRDEVRTVVVPSENENYCVVKSLDQPAHETLHAFGVNEKTQPTFEAYLKNFKAQQEADPGIIPNEFTRALETQEQLYTQTEIINLLPEEEIPEPLGLPFREATSDVTHQAKALFEWLGEAKDFDYQTSTENGEALHHFTVDTEVIWPEQFQWKGRHEKFVFSEDFRLKSWYSYEGGTVVSGVDYLEVKEVSAEEASTLFTAQTADQYDLHPVGFYHPLANLKMDTEAQCFEYDNVPLSSEENTVLLEEYADITQNLEDYFKQDFTIDAL